LTSDFKNYSNLEISLNKVISLILNNEANLGISRPTTLDFIAHTQALDGFIEQNYRLKTQLNC
jgi:hypothetical protein